MYYLCIYCHTTEMTWRHRWYSCSGLFFKAASAHVILLDLLECSRVSETGTGSETGYILFSEGEHCQQEWLRRENIGRDIELIIYQPLTLDSNAWRNLWGESLLKFILDRRSVWEPAWLPSSPVLFPFQFYKQICIDFCLFPLVTKGRSWALTLRRCVLCLTKEVRAHGTVLSGRIYVVNASMMCFRICACKWVHFYQLASAEYTKKWLN